MNNESMPKSTAEQHLCPMCGGGMMSEGGKVPQLANEHMLHNAPAASSTTSGSPSMDAAVMHKPSGMSITEELMAKRRKMASGGKVEQLQGGDDSDDAFEQRAEFSTHLDAQDAAVGDEKHDLDHTDDDARLGLVGQILKKRRGK